MTAGYDPLAKYRNEAEPYYRATDGEAERTGGIVRQPESTTLALTDDGLLMEALQPDKVVHCHDRRTLAECYKVAALDASNKRRF